MQSSSKHTQGKNGVANVCPHQEALRLPPKLGWGEPGGSHVTEQEEDF